MLSSPTTARATPTLARASSTTARATIANIYHASIIFSG